MGFNNVLKEARWFQDQASQLMELMLKVTPNALPPSRFPFHPWRRRPIGKSRSKAPSPWWCSQVHHYWWWCCRWWIWKEECSKGKGRFQIFPTAPTPCFGKMKCKFSGKCQHLFFSSIYDGWSRTPKICNIICWIENYPPFSAIWKLSKNWSIYWCVTTSSPPGTNVELLRSIRLG